MQPTLAETMGRIYQAAEQALAEERYEQAQSLLESLLPFLEKTEDRLGQARVLQQLGSVHELRSQWAAARQCYEAAREQVPEDAQETRAVLLHRLGHLWRASDPAKARECFRCSAALSDALSDRRGAALSRAMIGQIDFTNGEHDAGMTQMLAALTELPDDAPERDHLIEHAAYLSQRMRGGHFERLVRSLVLAEPLTAALRAAIAHRPKQK